jgi:hypothetical protein
MFISTFKLRAMAMAASRFDSGSIRMKYMADSAALRQFFFKVFLFYNVFIITPTINTLSS